MIKKIKRFTRKKIKKLPHNGTLYIKSTFNNSIANITDQKGNTLLWASAGSCGFSGTKKSTPFAAQTATEKVGKMAFNQGMREVNVIIRGPGGSGETAIRALKGCGLEILLIQDMTPIPHNGCRPPARRRV